MQCPPTHPRRLRHLGLWFALGCAAGACVLGRDGTYSTPPSQEATASGTGGDGSSGFVTASSNSSSNSVSSTVSTSSSGGAGGMASTWLAGYGYRKAITIPKGQVDGMPNRFAVPIVTEDADLKANAQPSGADIAFTAADGITQLPHEAIRFEAGTGKLIAWMNAPQLSSSSDSKFYMYYGNLSPSMAIAPMWPNHRGVWHLEEDPGPGNPGDVKDSSPAKNHLNPHEDFESKHALAGKIGNGIDIDVDTGTFLETTDNLGLTGNATFTLSMWFLPNDNPTDDYDLGKALFCFGPHSNYNAAFYTYYNSDEQTVEWGFWNNDTQSPQAYPKDQWYHLVQVYNGTVQTIYVNGTNVSSRTAGPLKLQSTKARIGLDTFDQGRYVNALFDEVWVSDVARSADWVATTYRSQNEPQSFVVFGTQEQAP